MRIAVISDIHGNMEALQSVLADIKANRTDAVHCLGDCVGYGPEPEAVIATLRDRKIPTVVGNHDLAVIEPKWRRWFNPSARKSLEMSLPQLTAESLVFIKAMPRCSAANGCRFVHGFPPDSPFTYLFSVETEKLAGVMAAMEQRICFVGHTHTLEFACFDGRLVARNYLHQEVLKVDPAAKYIFNIGSVGQPRDGDSNAKYVIYDDRQHTLEVRFVSYDIPRVMDKILAAGLPAAHAHRLS